MVWKNWSYWVKGGIIFTIIIFIFQIIGAFAVLSGTKNLIFAPFIFVQGFLNYPFGIPIANFLETLSFGIYPLTLLLNLVYLFIIGAIIGLIYGKIKNRGVNNKI